MIETRTFLKLLIVPHRIATFCSKSRKGYFFDAVAEATSFLAPSDFFSFPSTLEEVGLVEAPTECL
jgi:hypothetical protein